MEYLAIMSTGGKTDYVKGFDSADAACEWGELHETGPNPPEAQIRLVATRPLLSTREFLVKIGEGGPPCSAPAASPAS